MSPKKRSLVSGPARAYMGMAPEERASNPREESRRAACAQSRTPPPAVAQQEQAKRQIGEQQQGRPPEAGTGLGPRDPGDGDALYEKGRNREKNPVDTGLLPAGEPASAHPAHQQAEDHCGSQHGGPSSPSKRGSSRPASAMSAATRATSG